MGTTLQHGIFLPAEGERNCYTGLASNWTILDGMIGGYSSHAANLTIHVTAEDKSKWDAVTSKADASALTAHTGDTTIHVTAADKEAWNGKADASALTAHTGDTTIHVTAEDKAKWDTVTGKADDTSVMHKTGDETAAGKKTFTDEFTASRNATNGAIILQNASYDPKTNGQSGVSTKSFSINFVTALSDTFCAVSGYGLSDRTMIRMTSRYFNDAQNILEDSVEYNLYGDGTRSFRPRNNNNCYLGESIRKWKDVYTNLINGLNPGALFLPVDRGSRVDISAYFTNTENGDENTYTAPANGYIFLDVTAINKIILFSQTANQQTNYAQTLYGGTDGRIYSFFPVRKNDLFKSKWYTGSAASVTNAFFLPCQGNI